MASVKLTYEDVLRRDIDQLDDRLDRLELVAQHEQAQSLQIERQRLVDELGELTLINTLSRPQVQPIAWTVG